MRTQSSDTSPKAEKVLIDLLRKAGTTKRLSMAINLSSTTMRLSKRAIQRANPNLDENELKILFVKYHYGKELSEKFKQSIHKKNL